MGPTVNPLRHMYLNGYSKAMARSSKQLEPLDEALSWLWPDNAKRGPYPAMGRGLNVCPVGKSSGREYVRDRLQRLPSTGQIPMQIWLG